MLDYAGFILNSLNASDRADLQVLQNNALRICYNIRRRDRQSIRNLHLDANLLSLSQRRSIQLLSLMYNHKKCLDVRRVANRFTRNANRFIFYTERYNNVKYRNSPYFKGAEMWNNLPIETIHSDNIFEFKKCLKKNLVYSP